MVRLSRGRRVGRVQRLISPANAYIHPSTYRTFQASNIPHNNIATGYYDQVQVRLTGQPLGVTGALPLATAASSDIIDAALPIYKDQVRDRLPLADAVAVEY